MNNSLARLIEGMIATLRIDVIPRIDDPYARGQAVGVIDVLNSIGHRIEWNREPLLMAVGAKQDLVSEIQGLLGDDAPVGSDGNGTPDALHGLSTAELLVARERLDAVICDLLHAAHGRDDASGRAAMTRLLAHMHDELEQEKAMTRKPLFAEIASGTDGRG